MIKKRVAWNKGKKISGMSGKHHSEESKKKSSDAQKGRKLSEEHKKKLSEAALKRKKGSGMTGKKHTKKSRIKESAKKQGIPYDEWEAFAFDSKYCPKFDETCRKSNREKYGRRCFICNMTEKANGQKLSVHHVDMNKAQGCESNWKLVPLCRSCHSKAHNDEIIARLGYMIKED